MKKATIWTLVVIGVVVLGLLIFSYPGIFFIHNLFFSSDCGNEFNNAFEVAVRNNDLNFCSSYAGYIKYGRSFEGGGDSCNLQETKAGIRKNDFQDSCLQAMAYSAKNIEFCKLIEEETSKGSCVLGIARDKEDINYCEVLEKTNDYYSLCIGDNN
jgi:hypothetical protein